MIKIITTVELYESKREAFLTNFTAVANQTRDEEGCIEYTLMVNFPTNLDLQRHVDSDTLVIIEKWDSLEDFERHLVSPHMLDYRMNVSTMVKNLSLQILEPVFEPNTIDDDFT